jgi:hypothetical protein
MSNHSDTELNSRGGRPEKSWKLAPFNTGVIKHEYDQVQGLPWMDEYLEKTNPQTSRKYLQADPITLEILFSDTFLSKDKDQKGILMHSVYHPLSTWDPATEMEKIPCGESSMWGDYKWVDDR